MPFKKVGLLCIIKTRHIATSHPFGKLKIKKIVFNFRCSSGQKIPQVLMDNCMLIYNENDTSFTHDFKFYPRVDHKVEKARNVTVNLIGQLWQDGTLATDKVLTTVTMVLEDPESSGACYLISEPAIKTFDNL